MEPADPNATTVVIGCGNVLRGDDGVGPALIHRLWERDLPPSVRLVDGGTAGMDVAFKMQGADRVILIDACRSGSVPGTLYEVPGEELAAIAPPTGMHSHAFKWDDALSFARWLLKDEYPSNVSVYLVEAAQLDFGAELSAPVRVALDQLEERLCSELAANDGCRNGSC